LYLLREGVEIWTWKLDIRKQGRPYLNRAGMFVG
jgi:hypothetical protein